VTGIKQK